MRDTGGQLTDSRQTVRVTNLFFHLPDFGQILKDGDHSGVFPRLVAERGDTHPKRDDLPRAGDEIGLLPKGALSARENVMDERNHFR